MTRGWVLALIATVAVAAGLALLTIVVLTTDDETLMLDLETGDCFELPDELADSTIAQVSTVDCAGPHGAEVFATGFRNPDRDLPYPADEDLFRAVDARCAAVLSEIPGATDRFGILPVIADEASWDAYRGRYVCVAIPYGGGTVSGSLGA
jgi:hypothetical protein